MVESTLEQQAAVIGRTQELHRLEAAITSTDKRVILLEGEAGVGKTRLLEESKKIADAAELHCPSIIDFYDTEMHSNLGIEQAIATYFHSRDNSAFENYRRFSTSRGIHETLREFQQRRWETFVNDYSALALAQRVILRFDTAERLAYEQDSPAVREWLVEDLHLPPSWHWLQERIGELPNTCVLIASRPTPESILRDCLREAYEDHLEILTLGNLSQSETAAYFNTTELGRVVTTESPDILERLHLLTRGRPILISLSLDWLTKGHWTPAAFVTPTSDLRAAKSSAESVDEDGAKWQDFLDEFEGSLIRAIMDLDDRRAQAIRYAALARKGCNAELLARLMSISQAEADEVISWLLTLSFVKPPRQGSDLFFLHDEMYDLVEKYIWHFEFPDYSRQATISHTIAKWYDERIHSLESEIAKEPDIAKRRTLRTRQQLLISERLYYQLDFNPKYGYRRYLWFTEIALHSKEHQWDSWLRNEMRWFVQHRGWRMVRIKDNEQVRLRRLEDPETKQYLALEQDTLRQWVTRYSARNERDEAVKLAKSILASPPWNYEPDLWRGGVEIALGTALGYMGGPFLQEATESLDAGINRLLGLDERMQSKWCWSFMLGNGYVARGIVARNRASFESAIEAYRQAAEHYRQIRFDSGLAEVLNNLSYIYIGLGWVRRATAICEKALEIRNGLADEYTIGLSLNTRGIIHERRTRPQEAIRDSGRAHDLFTEIHEERGLILAEINLGRAYRRRGRDLRWQSWEEDFKQSESFLTSAMRRQEANRASAERYYRIEAENELGCLYRDWGQVAMEQTGDSGLFADYMTKGLQHLNKSIRLTEVAEKYGDPFVIQRIDSMEDIARIHFYSAEYAQSNAAREMELSGMKGVLHDVQDLTDRYHDQHRVQLIRAKLHFELARLERLNHPNHYTEIGRLLGLAAGYAEGYSIDAPELHVVVSDATDWLSSLPVKHAQTGVDAMKQAFDDYNDRRTGKEAKLKSDRLHNAIDDVVSIVAGVAWPDDDPTKAREQRDG